MEQIDWHFIFLIYFVHTINPLVFSLIIPENACFFKRFLGKKIESSFILYKNFVAN